MTQLVSAQHCMLNSRWKGALEKSRPGCSRSSVRPSGRKRVAMHLIQAGAPVTLNAEMNHVSEKLLQVLVLPSVRFVNHSDLPVSTHVFPTGVFSGPCSHLGSCSNHHAHKGDWAGPTAPKLCFRKLSSSFPTRLVVRIVQTLQG